MKKRIGFIGNPSVLPVGSKDNTGNIIHGYAARAMFQTPGKMTTDASEENLRDVRSRFTHVGFVAATMLHVNRVPKYIASHEHAAEFVEKLQLPVCTFGFGCQAPLGQKISEAEVDPRSVRLLRAISANAKVIAVRGQFTADLCAKYGVKNVSVVGCQSCYYSGVTQWEAKPSLKQPPKRPVAYVSLSPDESHALRLMMAGTAAIIGQGDVTDEAIRNGSITRADFIADTANYWLPPFLRAMFDDGRVTRADYYDYIASSYHKFYNVPDWIAHIRENYDFCFGTRFHGNMAALLSGVPALWLVHDMRTKELCEHLGLPSFEHAALSGIKDIAELASHCDYSSFWAGFPARLKQFIEYVRANDVEDLLAPEFAGKAARIIVS
jgi:hypothetical protein